MAERSLQDFVQEVNGESRLRVEHDFGDGFVRLQTSEAERRQAAQDIQCSENIVIELLRNSRDAHASHIFLAVSKEGSRRTIAVIDDGDGIPPSMHEIVFEPRVTSKLDSSHMDAWGLHGRGMALFSIAQNALSARVVSSDVRVGCALSVTTDTNSLPEKTDQSSFPRFTLSQDDGSVNVRGPRNILRTSCEFAIESRESCNVYVGSPAEIASAMFSYGASTLSAIDRAFCKDPSSLPLVKRLATASDPRDFALMASGIGLDISQRTARRILDGELDEAPMLLERITIESPGRAPGKGRERAHRGRKLKLHLDDKQVLAEAARAAFGEVAQRYYLDGDVEPKVRVAQGKVTITIPVVDKS